MALSSITWQNVQHMPDDGNRYEAIEGDLYMTPAPTVRHQRVTLRIYRALHRLLQEAGHGEVFCAPLGVEFPATGEGVQEYCIVDPAKDAVDVWRFDDEPAHERVTDVLTVRVGSERVGEIDLGDVFRRE